MRTQEGNAYVDWYISSLFALNMNNISLWSQTDGVNVHNLNAYTELEHTS